MGDSDAAVQKMVSEGVCKEYVRDGVPMISFLEDVVGSKEGTKSSATVAKAMHTHARAPLHIETGSVRI